MSTSYIRLRELTGILLVDDIHTGTTYRETLADNVMMALRYKEPASISRLSDEELISYYRMTVIKPKINEKNKINTAEDILEAYENEDLDARRKARNRLNRFYEEDSDLGSDYDNETAEKFNKLFYETEKLDREQYYIDDIGELRRERLTQIYSELIRHPQMLIHYHNRFLKQENEYTNWQIRIRIKLDRALGDEDIESIEELKVEARKILEVA